MGDFCQHDPLEVESEPRAGLRPASARRARAASSLIRLLRSFSVDEAILSTSILNAFAIARILAAEFSPKLCAQKVSTSRASGLPQENFSSGRCQSRPL